MIEERKIQTFEYETTINSDGNIIGTCELGKAEIQLLNDSNEYSSLKGTWINTIHGSFYIHNVAPVQEKVNIKLSCYDIKYKLDKPYDSSKHQFPCTLKEWRNSIFEDCDVDYDDSPFPNSSLLLTKEPYIESNSSNRDVIKLIAQAGASAVTTDSTNKFYFSWFTNDVYEVEDWLELTTEKELSTPVSAVVLGRGDVGDNVCYPENATEDEVTLRIDNNYILDPQDTNSEDDLRYITRIPIYNQVNNLSYIVFNMRAQHIDNKLSIKLGDKVSYKDIWGNSLETPIMTKKIKYLGGDFSEDSNYEVILSSKEIKETSTDFSYSKGVKSDILRVERKADQAEKRIVDLVKEVYEEDGIVNEKFVQVMLELSKALIQVQQSGGNNLIKNSVGFAGTTEWDLTYDNEETSTINTQSSVELLENGTSGGAFLINGVKISQDIIVSPNSEYCFSCKVSKKPYGAGYVKIYNPGVEAQVWIKELSAIELLNYEEVKFDGIKISGNTLRVEIYGQEGTNLIVTDSMLNRGDLSSVWTQANGEILNTQVNITSNGMTVKSLQFDVNGQYVTINPLEFAGYCKENGIQIRSFTVNGNTFEANKLRVKKEVAMKPIKIVPVLNTQNNGWAFVTDSGGVNNG